jgi:subfamily B ATP-binding cassette protein MsbA
MPNEPGSLSRIFPFVRPYRNRLIGLFALTVLLSVFVMLPPLVMRAIINNVLTGDGRRELFRPLAVCMITLPLLTAFAHYVQTIGIAYLGQRFVYDIRVSLYSHLLSLSQRYFHKNSAGKIANRLMGDSGVVQQMLTAQSINIISDMVCAGFAITATFAINWRLAILLCIIVTIFVANYRMNIGAIRVASKGARSAGDRMSGGVQNRLSGNVAVKSFGTENRENTVFQAHSEATLGLSRQAMLAGNTFSMNTQLIQSLGQSSMYFLGCAMVLSGDLQYGDVVAFSAYAVQLLGPAVRFSELVRQLQNVSIATDRLFEIFEEEPEITTNPNAKPVEKLRGQVDFENVRFHYEEGHPVIRDFSLHVEAGQTIALIGPTGCGKSTILSLILRFYDITGGRLLMDGIDIRDIELPSLRRQFGIVLQEPLLFNVSIFENIRYGRSDASREEIIAAAKVAEIHNFIEGLPDGYDTVMGDSGVEISVGQKQRITIARAVAADPAILIMDEATSALDSDSEQAIQLAMDRVLQNRTCFVVAHRLSTIRNADQIVLLDEGVIAEQGNHEQLMAIPGGRYRELYEKHMGAGVIAEEEEH